MEYDDSPAIHALMMSVNEFGAPQRSTIVLVEDVPSLQRDGWVLVGVDPRDQTDYEYWVYSKHFEKTRWVSEKRRRPE